MHIVHVVRQYKPSVGGLEDACHNLCLQLARMDGVKVSVVTLNRLFSKPGNLLPAQEVIDGIPVTRIPYKGSSRYPIATKVLKHIETADVVHVHAIDFFFDFLSFTRFVHFKPLVASTHGGFFHTKFAAGLKKIYFQTITRMSCVAYKTICASSENDAETFSKISPKNVVTIENGVDVEKWRDAGSKAPTRCMIFIGRWSANKQVPKLFELLAALHKTQADWKLIIAGIPADDTAASLAAEAEKLGVSHAVQIAANPSQDDIKRLIGQASYIASASSYEGFGISVIEGLSAGLYPVVTPLPPFAKLVRALGHGATIDLGNMQRTATTIENIHTEFSANYDYIRSGCMELSKRYAWDDVAQKFMDVYRAACNKKA